VPQGRVLGAPLRSIDLAPTILESAGLGFPDPVEGWSFWGALSRGEAMRSSQAYMEEIYTHQRSPYHLFRSLTDGNLKIIGSTFHVQAGAVAVGALRSGVGSGRAPRSRLGAPGGRREAEGPAHGGGEAPGAAPEVPKLRGSRGADAAARALGYADEPLPRAARDDRPSQGRPPARWHLPPLLLRADLHRPHRGLNGLRPLGDWSPRPAAPRRRPLRRHRRRALRPLRGRLPPPPGRRRRSRARPGRRLRDGGAASILLMFSAVASLEGRLRLHGAGEDPRHPRRQPLRHACADLRRGRLRARDGWPQFTTLYGPAWVSAAGILAFVSPGTVGDRSSSTSSSSRWSTFSMAGSSGRCAAEGDGRGCRASSSTSGTR